jgi:thioredoxin 1
MDDELDRLREKRRLEMKEKLEHAGQGGVRTVDELHFAEFVGTNRFSVVDFWAEWCGPCRRVSPAIEELSQEFAGRVAFGKCNTDENQHLAMQFGITAIPSIMLFSNGRMVERIIGAYPKEAIRERIIRQFALER